MSDYTLGDTIYYAFTTRAFATGVPTALAGSPTLEIYENDSTSPIVEGAGKLVLTQNLASINGFNLATITATSGNGFEAGKTYHIILKTGTVGGTSVVGEVVGRFTLQASAAAADLANGTDGLGALKTDATAMKGATFDTATDSLEALRNRGDAAWITATGFAVAGDAMTLTAAYDFAKGTAAMTESYAANGVAPTPVQAFFAIHQMLQQFAISGTSLTVRKLDNTTTAFVVTLDDATAPTSAART